MGHILENKVWDFIDDIIVSINSKNTGLVDYIKGRENFTDAEGI